MEVSLCKRDSREFPPFFLTLDRIQPHCTTCSSTLTTRTYVQQRILGDWSFSRPGVNQARGEKVLGKRRLPPPLWG